ncbi:TfoX/Sxy family protein [Silvibacterium dinghuense]|uniref:Cold-shock protein n=1 Tax=Silvibacterium dinghuense TaxID=1560006 RepID=A0A4Q1SJ64_9BACT|nr:TfoX/Sxy family protein [Silvibacterium dinghuense]RXS97300.1 cold-shock protein [Silvibacterium dinghuense]GGG97897.1 cold-shock protein [Silvibacterium dinghuense]
MPRDPGLEELIHSVLGEPPGLTEKAMFGGWAYLLHGNLLCGARTGSLMLRIGRDNEAWALALPGVAPMVSRGRRMSGYVRALPEAYADDATFQRLMEAAIAFTRTLPKK